MGVSSLSLKTKRATSVTSRAMAILAIMVNEPKWNRRERDRLEQPDHPDTQPQTQLSKGVL